MIGWLFSKRIRALEGALAHCQALLEKRYGDIKLTHMSYEDGKFDMSCMHEGIAGMLAAWAYNTLEACGAENYVEFEVRHPEKGSLLITCARKHGESPASKAARLERELSLALTSDHRA